MGIYKDYLLPICINWLLSREECIKLRKCVVKKLNGVVLEVGFGSGLNLPYYPESVKSIYAVDPCMFGRRLASKRIEECGIPVNFVESKNDGLLLDTNSIDTILSTWTLCTIPDMNYTLNEMRRVLKPDGKFYFLEHGLSPEKNIANWQNRLNPVQKLIGGGCQLNIKIDNSIKMAGFHIEELETFYMNGPKSGSYMYKGFAVNAVGS